MRRLFLALGLCFALPLGCASNEDPTGTGTVDSGRKDTGRSDTATTADTTGTDSYVPPTDTGPGTETGPKTCDGHAGDECDIVLQNCTDATATCVYDSGSKHNVCQKLATGTKLKGENCGSQSECDRGLFCYGGKCSPACCSGDDSTCGTGGACNLAITDSEEKVIHYACSYNPSCKPFKYDCPSGMVCLFNDEPDVFKCSTPSSSGGLGKAPGGACTYVNDCGESQACFTLSTGGDTGGATAKCYLFCWMMTPSGFTPGTTPDGRFPADGDCNVGGTNYGTCQSVSGIGGGLGVCVK